MRSTRYPAVEGVTEATGAIIVDLAKVGRETVESRRQIECPGRTGMNVLEQCGVVGRPSLAIAGEKASLKISIASKTIRMVPSSSLKNRSVEVGHYALVRSNVRREM